jgi:L-galactose dehydrogenase
MQYRDFGNTGLKVSALSLGGGPLGGFYGPVDEAEGVRCVHTALDLGINFIDTAPFYGITRSESRLGEALKGVPRDRYYLSTKVGRYDHRQFDFSAARVTASVDESLKRLQIDYADVIVCHDIEFTNMQQIVDETLPALRKVRDAGKFRFLAVSGLPLKIYRYILDRTDLDVILSYCHCALNDTTLLGLVPYLNTKGVGIINASPLSMGLLANAPMDWHPAPEVLKQTATKAAEHCKKRGTSLERLAIQFAGSVDAVNTHLVGAAQTALIERNVQWFSEKPDPQLLAEVREIFKPVQDMTWQSGLAENN